MNSASTLPAPWLRPTIHYLLLSLLLLVTLLFYWRGLGGDFIFDDMNNIQFNPRVKLNDLSWEEISKVWGSGVASDIGRPLSMLSFGLNYYFAGDAVWWYKLTNVFIHLLTALSVYGLSLALIEAGSQRGLRLPHAELLALLITAAWTLHPLHASTVLYVVQRMTQLAAFFTFLALLVYCRFRMIEAPSARRAGLTLVMLALLLLLAVLSKENGILAVPLMLVTEWVFFRWRASNSAQRRFLQVFTALFVALPALAILVFVALKPTYLFESYQYRAFTLGERLLTQGRVLWDYIGWILTPDTRDYTFFHDNYPLSRSLIDPFSTVVALLGIGALVAVVVFGWRRLPWLSFGVGFFLVGQLLESTVLPLEIAFEHRNYLPAYGLLLGIFLTLFSMPLVRHAPFVMPVVSVVFTAIATQGLWVENSKWANTPTFLLTLESLLPDSQRVQYNLGYMYFKVGETLERQDYLQQAQYHFKRSAALDERQFGGLVGLVLTNNQLGQDTSDADIQELSKRIATAPINTGGLMDFVNLTHCYLSRQCERQPQILIDTYQAIAANTLLSAPAKQVVLNEIATDILLSLQLTEDALNLYYFTESLSQELTMIDLRIIVLEMQRENLDAARKHLEKSRNKPGAPTGLLQGLDDLEQQLEARSR